MLRAFDTLDEQTRKEYLTAAMAMMQAFEEAAAQVNQRFPKADPQSKKILIRETGLEIIEGVALGLEYDETINNVSEGQVAQMLKSACQP